MKFSYAAALLFILFSAVGIDATTTKSAKKSTARKTTSSAKKGGTAKVAAGQKTATSGSATSSSAKSKSKGKTAKKAPAVTWRSRQQNPTPDRYKEIQGALAAKGYLKSDPSGVWDADSISALQRFQSDQKLTPNGKINAPSLIGLGLGAKSAGAAEASPIGPPAQPAVPVTNPAPAEPPPSDATHP
jgi:hypothetical protein